MMKTKQQKNNSVTVVNKDQIQSYIMTTAKYDFSVYEKRILYRIVEMAQGELQGVRFATDCKKIEHTLFDTVHITMPIASLLNGESDENYTRVKQALLSLQKKIFTYEDEKEWISISIIALPKIKKRSSVVSFQIDSHIWDCCLDFSKGFRKYELATAMKFKSVYSMRFYELLSGQKTKLIYPLEQLKEMFKVQDKYAKTNDFVRKVIEPAKNELDELSPYTFEWSANKEGKKIVSFNFYPIFKPEHRDAELYKKIGADKVAQVICAAITGQKTESEGLTMTQYEELKQEIAEVKPAVYDYMDNNMPEWAKPTIQKLMDKGVLVGDEDGRLGLTMDMIKVFVINDRAGLYD